MNIIIAIDGPAGAGKSTIAKEVAKRLQISYLDTGAMYRALTLKALRQGVDLSQEEALVNLTRNSHIDLCGDPQKGLRVFLDGEDITEAIRSVEVTNNTFYIARTPGVRGIMVERQRQIGERSGVVAEGRDIGTVVFPRASIKFYLDACFEERAGRRIKEMKDKGQDVQGEEIKNDLYQRDQKDFTRTIGPLKRADDAIYIDSTRLSIEEVVRKILSFVEQKFGLKAQDPSCS